MRGKHSIVSVILVGAVLSAGFFFYSWGWSERLLAPVRMGMSQSQVRTLLGSAPRIRRQAGEETWDYTRPWSRDARVYFDTNGLVYAVETD